MKLRLCLLAFAFALSGCEKPSTDLANRAAAALRKALPGYQVAVVDGLTLKLGHSGQPSHDVSLERLQDDCNAAPAGCNDAIAGFVMVTTYEAKADETPLTASMLFATVRANAYLDLLRERSRDAPGSALVARPFAGDVSILCEFDFPNVTRPALVSALKKIDVAPESAIALCMKNMEAHLPPLDPQLHVLGPSSLGILQGDGYTSSQFLFPGRWAAYAAKYKTGLIVAVPGDDIVLYSPDDGPVAEDAVRTFAQQAEKKAGIPISHTVFRWTPGGWQVVE